jgi:hypothetical protein
MAFKGERWTVATLLPVGFVAWIISTIWVLYGTLHLLPLLQLQEDPAHRDEDRHRRGVVQACVSQTLTAIMLICFLSSICTDPGGIPDSPEWRQELLTRESRRRRASSNQEAEEKEKAKKSSAPKSFEVKHTGERRFCKWCDKYKPDRCHHCRVCKSCILRMDHHCPWIANCVGYRNHKFFLLLVLYSLATVDYIVFTMSESVSKTITEETTPSRRFLLVFCMTLSVIMCTLLHVFLGLHIMLTSKATTTIEFCEKRHRRVDAVNILSYDYGTWANFQAVLGPNPLLWLVPCGLPQGDGLYFPVARKCRLSTLSTDASVDREEKEAESTDKKAASSSKEVDDVSPPEVTGARAASA